MYYVKARLKLLVILLKIKIVIQICACKDVPSFMVRRQNFSLDANKFLTLVCIYLGTSGMLYLVTLLLSWCLQSFVVSFVLKLEDEFRLLYIVK